MGLIFFPMKYITFHGEHFGKGITKQSQCFQYASWSLIIKSKVG